jgi:anti-anti-sigma factor
LNSTLVSERGVRILHAQGRITIGPELEQLRAAFDAALAEAADDVRLVLDLGDVPYLDSAALGEIVAQRRRVALLGGEVIVARPRGKVRDLLDLTRLERLVTIHDDLAHAVDALAREH